MINLLELVVAIILALIITIIIVDVFQIEDARVRVVVGAAVGAIAVLFVIRARGK